MTAAFLSYPLWNASTHFLLEMTTENTMFPTEFGIYPLSFGPGHSELWNTPKSLGCPLCLLPSAKLLMSRAFHGPLATLPWLSRGGAA